MLRRDTKTYWGGWEKVDGLVLRGAVYARVLAALRAEFATQDCDLATAALTARCHDTERPAAHQAVTALRAISAARAPLDKLRCLIFALEAIADSAATTPSDDDDTQPTHATATATDAAEPLTASFTENDATASCDAADDAAETASTPSKDADASATTTTVSTAAAPPEPAPDQACEPGSPPPKAVSADVLLPLAVRCLLDANVPAIHAELAFVERFSRDDFLGIEGYALTTFYCAIAVIIRGTYTPDIISPNNAPTDRRRKKDTSSPALAAAPGDDKDDDDKAPDEEISSPADAAAPRDNDDDLPSYI